jgi:hypothetical protein
VTSPLAQDTTGSREGNDNVALAHPIKIYTEFSFILHLCTVWE